jgi:hypothetical protein
MVKFRPIEGSSVKDQLSEIHPPLAYLIVRELTRPCGKLFVSFKQPEDLPLAPQLEQFARQAGFEPYLAIHDSPTRNRIMEADRTSCALPLPRLLGPAIT